MIDEKNETGKIDDAKWAREHAEACFKQAHPDEVYEFPSEQGQVLYYGLDYPVGGTKPTHVWIYHIMVEQEGQERIKVMLVVRRDPHEVHVSEFRPAQARMPTVLPAPADSE